MLRALRRSGWSIWPFDPPGSHTVVEIYPRLFTGAVVKSRNATRLECLAQIPELETEVRSAMIGSEDAFDAGLSAIAMSRAAGAGATWPIVDPTAVIEGQIWVPGPARARVDAGQR